MVQPPSEGADSSRSGTSDPDPSQRLIDLDSDSDDRVPDSSSGGQSREAAGASTTKAGLKAVARFVAAVLVTLSTAGLATIEWGGYQRETDLRAALVTDVNTSVAHVGVSAYLIATGAVGIEKSGKLSVPLVKKKHHEVRAEWEQDAARIRGQLEAYYTHPDVGMRWQEYAAIVSNHLMLSYPAPQNKNPTHLRKQARSRRALVKKIEGYLRKKGKTLQPSLKETVLRRQKDLDDYAYGYEALGNMFSEEQAAINKDILSLETRVAPPFGIVRLLQRLL
jgi:hypothetical protein